MSQLWSKTEIADLKEHYSQLSCEELHRLYLHDRSVEAIQCKRAKLRLKKAKVKRVRVKPSTPVLSGIVTLTLGECVITGEKVFARRFTSKQHLRSITRYWSQQFNPPYMVEIKPGR